MHTYIHIYTYINTYTYTLIDALLTVKDDFEVLVTNDMVGLWVCVFIRSHLREKIRNLAISSIARGGYT